MRSWDDFYQEGHLSKELVAEKPIIALYGCFQVGKSTIINCLLNRYMALTGAGLATTSLTARYKYGAKEQIQYRRANSELADVTPEQLNNLSSLKDICSDGSFHIEARTSGQILQLCDIVDTPGFNAKSSDTEIALSIIRNVNYCLFIIPNKELSHKEQELLKQLTQKGMTLSVIMNCSEGRGMPNWLPAHSINRKILEENEAWLSSAGIPVKPLGGKKIFPCNALFYWSQQADFEKNKKFLDRGDSVLKHIKSLLDDEGENSSTESIISLSQISLLIESLKQQIKNYNPLKHTWR